MGGNMMRRILAVTAVAFGLLIASGCTPTATVTAIPSTTRPACKAVTTVTGKVTPATAVKEVTLETQPKAGGAWEAYVWFENASDGKGVIEATVNQTTGAYSLTYLAPNNISLQTTRLRIHGYIFKGAEVISASWYVTKPSGC